MRLDKLDLNLLVVLDALLSHQNTSRVGEELHVTQSTVSAALARLRDYFEDELLVPVGRRMELTPRAQSLQDPVRDIIVRIRTTIAAKPEFDPAQSDRVFTLLASDYALQTFIPEVVARSAAQRYAVRFRVLPLKETPATALDRGDADLLIVPEVFRAAHHPCEVLLEEQLVCVVWSGSKHANKPLGLDEFLAASHVLMEPTANNPLAFDGLLMQQAGIQRRMAVSTYSFSSMAALLVNTEYVATMQSRLAAKMAVGLPLTVLDAPFVLPRMPLLMQWHAYRSSDPATNWLRNALKAAVA